MSDVFLFPPPGVARSCSESSSLFTQQLHADAHKVARGYGQANKQPSALPCLFFISALLLHTLPAPPPLPDSEEEESVFRANVSSEYTFLLLRIRKGRRSRKGVEKQRRDEEEARQRARLFVCLSISACDLVRICMKLLSEQRGGLRARPRYPRRGEKEDI